jgi:hypothetical protein
MPETNEPEVTLESIDNALDTLIKATEATDLAKALGGVAVDQGGHVDERGQTKGGYADTGDVGGLDSMMVGRMEQALIEQGFPAAAIAAFMRGKQEEEEDEDEKKEREPNEPPAAKMGKPADSSGGVGTNPRLKPPAHGNTMGKSADAFLGDPAIANAIDVSPYLEALVQRTCEQLDGFTKSMGEQGAKQDEVNKSMAVAMYGIGQLMKGVAAHATRLDQRLGLVERQPNPPKGATSQPAAAAMAKSFGAHGAEGQPGQLTKSMVISTLSYLNLEKGVKHIGGRETAELIYLYEGGGQLAPQAFHAVQRFLATNPSEAPVALSYR